MTIQINAVTISVIINVATTLIAITTTVEISSSDSLSTANEVWIVINICVYYILSIDGFTKTDQIVPRTEIQIKA